MLPYNAASSPESEKIGGRTSVRPNRLKFVLLYIPRDNSINFSLTEVRDPSRLRRFIGYTPAV